MRARFLVGALVVVTGCVDSPAATPKPTAPPSALAKAGVLAPIHATTELPEDAVGASSEPVPGFMRGINLGNGLDAPNEGEWGVVLKPEHFSMAKAAGLDHVRLPVRFSVHAAKDAPYAIDEALLKRVDWAVEQAHANGLSVIIDLHHYEELMKDPKANAD